MSRRVSVISAQVCAGGIDSRQKIEKTSDERSSIGAPTNWNPSSSTLGGGGSLKGKTLLISGASRGIGLAIAKRAAKDGANIIVCAKTTEEHSTLPGTIYSAAKEIEEVGGQALPCIMNVRDELTIASAVAEGVKRFGGIDIVINCASAIFPTPTDALDVKEFNLMWEITTRSPLLVAKYCIPHLKASAAAGRNPHIISCGPPINFQHMPQPSNPNYMVCKMGMTVGTMAMAEELRSVGIAANTLWPDSPIATSALNGLAGNDPNALDKIYQGARTPEVQADAAYLMLTSSSKGFSGNQTIDVDVLSKAGVTDLSRYDYMTLGATKEERLKRIIRM